MNKNKGVKNSKIRSYLYERVPEVLNKNPFFVKVYGKDFAKKRLKSGITTVYTNAEPQRKSCLGYHVYSEKAIILCSQEKDDKILTIDDIENNELLKEIILHECIHSILERTKKECFSYGIKNGTGLLERYYANEETGKESELGRGLNEGFTEWLCEKCGYKVLGYSELTNYIRLIELALGTEKVMEFGKGNIYERLPEIMNISYNEVVELLSLGDTLYSLDENINTLLDLIEKLKNQINENRNQDKVKELYYSVNELVDIRNDPAYLSYIKSKKLRDNDDILLEYLNEELKKLEERKNFAIINFESKILNLYFKEDIEQIMSDDQNIIDKDNLEKICKIVSVLNTTVYDIPERLTQGKEYSSIKLKEVFEKFCERYNYQFTNSSISISEEQESVQNESIVLEENDINR